MSKYFLRGCTASDGTSFVHSLAKDYRSSLGPAQLSGSGTNHRMSYNVYFKGKLR